MKINNIFVIGGGTAGAMTACVLKKTFPDFDIKILQGRNIPVIGVGESTLGQINSFLSLLEIEDKDFMKECDAIYKLSIRFEDFSTLNDGGFHYPFGDPYFDNSEITNYNSWYYKKFLYPETPTTDFADCMYPQMAMINENKITDSKILFPTWSFKKDVAYQFDAVKFGHWLKEKYFKKIGGEVVEGNIIKVNHTEDGSIASLLLDSQKEIKADLYIDCTGFKSLLLGQALKEPFKSYENILPNDSAWATKVPYKDKYKELKGWTNCKAIENGWIWNIPLWSRIGTGYVYSNKYIDDNDALEQFKKYLGTEDLDFKNIKMRIGVHNNLFVKNVCAIGLSGGFIEPLESNGLLTVHEWIMNLVQVLKKRYVNEFAKQHYTLACKNLFKVFAEFVAMHYALSDRTDTEYWRDIQKRQYPIEDKYVEYKSAFQSAYVCKIERNEWQDAGGLPCIATGMNWYPTTFETIKYKNNNGNENYWRKEWRNIINKLNERKEEFKKLANNTQPLYHYLKENIYTETIS